MTFEKESVDLGFGLVVTESKESLLVLLTGVRQGREAYFPCWELARDPDGIESTVEWRILFGEICSSIVLPLGGEKRIHVRLASCIISDAG